MFAMAGPVARRFVEAIEKTLAEEIVSMAKNRPARLVFYLYLHDSVYAMPFAMISKYEGDMNDEQFKVRTFGTEEFDEWDRLEPIFPDIDSCSKYIATHYCPEPDRFCIGTRFLRSMDYPLGARHTDDLKNKSTAREWLMECTTMYADYLDESGILQAAQDDPELQWSWVEGNEDHFRELLENQIDFLATIIFTGMDF